MAYFGEVMRSIRTEQLSLAYPSSYVECAGRRRAIPPPIAYNPELARCTHEASGSVTGLVKGCVCIRDESSTLCTQSYTSDADAGYY